MLVAAHDDPSGVLSVLDALALQTVIPRRVTVLTSPDAEEAIDAAIAHGARVITAADTAAAVDEALAQGGGGAADWSFPVTRARSAVPLPRRTAPSSPSRCSCAGGGCPLRRRRRCCPVASRIPPAITAAPARLHAAVLESLAPVPAGA